MRQMSNDAIVLFNLGFLFDLLEQYRRSISEEIRREAKPQILNVNESQYVEYILSKYHLDVPEIIDAGIRVESTEVEVPAEQHGPTWSVTPGRTYPRQKLTYEVPFSGDPELFQYSPSHRTFSPGRVRLLGNRLLFDYLVLHNTASDIKNQFERALKEVCDALETMRADVKNFEETLPGQVEAEFKARKQKLLEQDQNVASLGVPVKAVKEVPNTLIIPGIQQRKPIIPKPSPSSGAYHPEYKLDDEVYEKILRVCYDLGVHMERHPSLYDGKGEEALRDEFLLMLSPHFQSTAGEVFNRAGKTDILIRHEKKNVFVAECKFWGGESAFHATIDQLLSYLTWRDSCAAILCFNRNKEHDPVLAKIPECTPKHLCFVRARPPSSGGFFHFDFHLLNDDTRGVRLAVLCFHFPK